MSYRQVLLLAIAFKALLCHWIPSSSVGKNIHLGKVLGAIPSCVPSFFGDVIILSTEVIASLDVSSSVSWFVYVNLPVSYEYKRYSTNARDVIGIYMSTLL